MSDQVEQRPLDRQVRRLPENFVTKGLELAKDAMLFGVSIDELSREELIAAAAQGWKAYSNQLEQGMRDLEFIGEARRRR